MISVVRLPARIDTMCYGKMHLAPSYGCAPQGKRMPTHGWCGAILTWVASGAGKARAIMVLDL